MGHQLNLEHPICDTDFENFFSGPLLYHFADMPSEMSIELSWTDLKGAILKFGFQLLVRIFFITPTVTIFPSFEIHLDNKPLDPVLLLARLVGTLLEID